MQQRLFWSKVKQIWWKRWWSWFTGAWFHTPLSSGFCLNASSAHHFLGILYSVQSYSVYLWMFKIKRCVELKMKRYTKRNCVRNLFALQPSKLPLNLESWPADAAGGFRTEVLQVITSSGPHNLLLFLIWTNTFLFGQIHFVIWTNTFGNLDKYIW